MSEKVEYYVKRIAANSIRQSKSFFYTSGTTLQGKRVWFRLWVYLLGLYMGCLSKNWVDFHYKETKNKQVVCQRCAGKHVAMRHAYAQC